MEYGGEYRLPSPVPYFRYNAALTGPAKKTRVFLLEDHVILRHGLTEVLRHEADLTVIGEAGTVEEAAAKLAHTKPDILVLDLRLPRGDGLTLLPRMKQLSAHTRILVLTASEREHDVAEAMRLGAHGYIRKQSSTAAILKSIRRVAAGEIYLEPAHLEIVLRAFQSPVEAPREISISQLSPRERQIIQLVIAGCKNKEIGVRLSISEKTVKNHLSNIFDKMGVSDRLELALHVVERKLL